LARPARNLLRAIGAELQSVGQGFGQLGSVEERFEPARRRVNFPNLAVLLLQEVFAVIEPIQPSDRATLMPSGGKVPRMWPG